MFCKCLTTEADVIVCVNFQLGFLLGRSVFLENKKNQNFEKKRKDS